MQKNILNKTEIGNRINTVRIDLNLTYSELANRLNIPKGTVNSWIRGLSFPRDYILHKLSAMSGKPYEWFLFGGDGKYKQCNLCGDMTQSDLCTLCMQSQYNQVLSIKNIINDKEFPLPNEAKEIITRTLIEHMEIMKNQKTAT